MKRIGSRQPLSVAVALTCSLALAACSSGGTGQAGSSSGGSGSTSCGGTYSADEVTMGAAPNKVVPVYAVPKCGEKTTLAFLQIDKSIPYFASIDDGIQAAAKFYGVELLLTDLQNKPAETLNQYQALSVKRPQVVGTMINASDMQLYNRTKADGIPMLLIESSLSNPAPPVQSVADPDFDKHLGALVGKMLGEEAKKRQAAQWKGKEIYFVQVAEKAIPNVMVRVNAALDEFKKAGVDVPADHVLQFDTENQQTTVINRMNTVLTAHPNAVFAVAPLNDEFGVAAARSLVSNNRGSDGIVALLGGDKVGRDAIRADSTGTVIGAVFSNPFQEGWNWVEAAIALKRGDKFSPVSGDYPLLTKENINQMFPGNG